MQQIGRAAFAIALVVATHIAVEAHGDEVHVSDVLGSWTFDPVVIAALLVSAGLYLIGTRSLWRAASEGRGVSIGAASCFAAEIGRAHV